MAETRERVVGRMSTLCFCISSKLDNMPWWAMLKPSFRTREYASELYIRELQNTTKTTSRQTQRKERANHVKLTRLWLLQPGPVSIPPA